MNEKFEARFDQFIKGLGGERTPSANASGEQRAEYIVYAVFAKLG